LVDGFNLCHGLGHALAGITCASRDDGGSLEAAANRFDNGLGGEAGILTTVPRYHQRSQSGSGGTHVFSDDRNASSSCTICPDSAHGDGLSVMIQANETAPKNG